MRRDDGLRNDTRRAFDAIAVPPIDMAAIRAKELMNVVETKQWRVNAGPWAAAAAVLLIVAFGFVRPSALLAEAQSNVVMFLNVLGIRTVPVDASIVKKLQANSHRADVDSARREVDFTLIPPSGLPSDAVQQGIDVSATGQWSAKTRKWAVGEKVALFDYRRPNGAAFTLSAKRYDASDRFSAYIWEAVEDSRGHAIVSNGREKLIRHEQFFWRNGDQVMSAQTGNGLTREEIASIRDAMGGVPVATVKTAGPRGGARVLLVKP